MKKIYIFILMIFLITGCSTKEEEKSEYLAWKGELVKQEEFTTKEELNCEIVVSVERIDDEIISYTTTINNPKENMHDVKVMVIHNYFTEDVFPTVGVFNESKDLIKENNDSITLVGYIETSKDIKSLNLELKIWIEYTSDDGSIKDIYYKTTK